MIRARGLQCESRVHFFALCAQMIRRILVDHARHRRYAKRSGDTLHVPLDEALLGTRARGVKVLALDEALGSLSKTDPRKVRVVELRYFGGLSIQETADVLQVAPETVMRDWENGQDVALSPILPDATPRCDKRTCSMRRLSISADRHFPRRCRIARI